MPDTAAPARAGSPAGAAPAASTWTLWLDPAGRPGWQNMAIDRGLLDLAEQGCATLRLYRWDPPCLSLGAHEPALRRYDRARIAALGMDVVRRPTGGRAVWHDAELTYALAAPQAVLGGLRDAYLTIHRLLADAVIRLGAAATLAPAASAPPLDTGACFASPVGGEVTVGGRKVVGSAQVRQETALLQHGSLLLGADQQRVARVTRGLAPAGAEAALEELLGRPVPFEEAAQAVTAAARAWRPGWHTVADSAPFLDAARPHEARFRSDAWTWRR